MTCQKPIFKPPAEQHLENRSVLVQHLLQKHISWTAIKEYTSKPPSYESSTLNGQKKEKQERILVYTCGQRFCSKVHLTLATNWIVISKSIKKWSCNFLSFLLPLVLRWITLKLSICSTPHPPKKKKDIRP